MKYRKEIDGLRAIAIIPVILFHAGYNLVSGGFIGVDIFFVISGYLITTIILSEHEIGSFSIIRFYKRRAKRILPALFFVMLACIPFALMLMLPSQMRSFSKSLIAATISISNILFWSESGYFAAIGNEKPLLHTWSLAVEEQYYLIYPALALIGLKLGKKYAWYIIVITAILSFILCNWGEASISTNFFFLHSRAWELLSGAIIAFIIFDHGVQSSNILSTSGFFLILVPVFIYNEKTPYPSYYTLAPVLGTALVIMFSGTRTFASRFLSINILVGTGLISYSLYLWHQPIFAFARLRGIDFSTPARSSALILLYLLATLSWKFIEKPSRKRQGIPIYLVIAGSALLLIGYIGWTTNGSFYRWDNQVGHFHEQNQKNANYVWENHSKFLKSAFQGQRIKILIVGDSGSGDFLNSLIFSDYDKRFSYSTLKIGHGCGNLYLPIESIISLASNDCNSADFLGKDSSKSLLKDADWVFLANNWEEWEVKLFDQSLKNLKNDFGDKFWVVGTKMTEFTAKDLEQLLLQGDIKTTYAHPKDKGLTINSILSQVSNDKFIDPYKWLCKSGKCAVIDVSQGGVIQFDGFHLTETGARSFGKNLNSTGIITKLYNT